MPSSVKWTHQEHKVIALLWGLLGIVYGEKREYSETTQSSNVTGKRCEQKEKLKSDSNCVSEMQL